MSVRLILRDEALTARISGEIDHHTAREVRTEIDSAAQKVRPKKLYLDFSDVPFMDSSGIGLIMGRLRLMQMWGGSVVLKNISAPVERMIRLSGLTRLVDIERGEENETDK